MMCAAARLLPLALLVGVPGASEAHLVNSGLGPFYNGTLHLLLSPGDLLAVLAVGLLAGQSGKASARWAVLMLPLTWGVTALDGVAPDAAASLDWIAVALLILLGILVAASVRLPASVMVALAASTGLVHGLENGGVLAASDSGFVAVAGIATGVLVLSLLTAAFAVSLRAAWSRIALRVGGSWIAAIGMLMLGWMLQGTS